MTPHHEYLERGIDTNEGSDIVTLHDCFYFEEQDDQKLDAFTTLLKSIGVRFLDVKVSGKTPGLSGSRIFVRDVKRLPESRDALDRVNIHTYGADLRGQIKKLKLDQNYLDLGEVDFRYCYLGSEEQIVEWKQWCKECFANDGSVYYFSDGCRVFNTHSWFSSKRRYAAVFADPAAASEFRLRFL